MRVALIADTHLSERSPECVANWHAARRAVERLDAELTVHLGDITLDAEHAPEELAYAGRLVAAWPTAMRCLPGNHDMGTASGEARYDRQRLQAYELAFGADHWWLQAEDWHLIGVNAQLFGSGSVEEAQQWRWLEDAASSMPAGSRTALFLHRPVVRPLQAERWRSGRNVEEAACARLLGGPLERSLRIVVSGHTHQHLDFQERDVRHVWMPSCGFVLPDGMQPRVGEKVVGIGLLRLASGAEAAFDLWCPDGMVRHDLTGLQAFADLADAA
jgi:predicted phosphodiesterase